MLPLILEDFTQQTKITAFNSRDVVGRTCPMYFLRAFEDENGKLKKLFAEQMLDKHSGQNEPVTNLILGVNR